MSVNAVLLAEREPASRDYIERQLRDDGFTVFGAAWTARALDIAERLQPNVVIAGEPELCRRIRAGEPGRRWDRNVPVILLTEPDADPIAPNNRLALLTASGLRSAILAASAKASARGSSTSRVTNPAACASAASNSRAV